MRQSASFVFVLFAFSATVLGDWPQFNGPDRDGISKIKHGLAKEWPADGPRAMWRVALGEGFGAPSVSGDEVYILDRISDTHDNFRCLDRTTGEERWSYRYSTRGRFGHPGSRSVPTIGEANVYTVGSFGHIHAFDRQGRKVAWSRHMSEFGGEPPRWGFSQSPLLLGDHVIIAPMSDSVGMAALDQKTGETVWTSKSIGGGAYTSPRLFTIDGVEQLVLLTNDTVAGINPTTGDILWTWDGFSSQHRIANPSLLEGNRLFLTGAYRSGSVMIRVARHDGGGALPRWRVEELFRSDEGSHLHDALVYEGHMYANLNTNENLGGRRSGSPMGLVCMNDEGEILWKTERSPQVDRGGFIIADDMIVSLGGQDGVLRLIEATPEGYREIAAAPVFEEPGNNLWGPPALSNNLLFVRSQSELVCLDMVMKTNDE